jgi:hypothetical protein
MAIYGINFGAPPIPQVPRTAFRKFPARVKRLDCNHAALLTDRIGKSVGCPTCTEDEPVTMMRKVTWFHLVGIATSLAERNQMLIQATNGHRHLHTLVRNTPGGDWYGIYTD